MNLGKILGIAIAIIIIGVLVANFYAVIVSIFEDPSLMTIVGGTMSLGIIAFLTKVLFFRKKE